MNMLLSIYMHVCIYIYLVFTAGPTWWEEIVDSPHACIFMYIYTNKCKKPNK